LELVERRVDNVAFRLGFAPTRLAARQLVVQGHIIVNGKKVTSPAYEVKVGDHVGAREASKEMGMFATRKEFLKKYDVPAWLRLDAEKVEGEVLSLPADVELPIEINLLVESFSK
jgi:small subunit ribosomal protein S4